MPDADDYFELFLCVTFFVGIILFFIGKGYKNSTDPEKIKTGEKIWIASLVFVLPQLIVSFYRVWIK
jgi:hypothetical protein